MLFVNPRDEQTKLQCYKKLLKNSENMILYSPSPTKPTRGLKSNASRTASAAEEDDAARFFLLINSASNIVTTKIISKLIK